MLNLNNILAIETSCDETAAAIVLSGRYVKSNVISSQIDIHKQYGGVIPELASRNHLQNISCVIDQALTDSQMNFQNIDAIAVTIGPGLVGALLVGLSYAKTLAFTLNKPLLAVNHIEGHICANYLENDKLSPPFMCVVVSGGHTMLVYVRGFGEYEIVGRTRDDAAGEAYDKVARVLGLGYPGGPAIDKLAMQNDMPLIKFPRALPNDLDFSFSGLKSSVINYVQKNELTDDSKKLIADSFQQSVIDVIITKTFRACQKHNCKVITLAGGVASNYALRKTFHERCDELGYELNIPLPIFCTDNAAMIASAAFFNPIASSLNLNAVPNLKLNSTKENNLYETDC